jgi:NADPH2:quinone reductase
LIHGASGGVGLAALQLAIYLGAKTIAVVSSEEKSELLSEYRTTDVLVYPEGGFKDNVNAITYGVGADVIFDPVGGNVFAESTKCIAPFGRLLIVGFAGGQIATAVTNHILIKQYSVVGVRAGEFGRIDQVRGEEVMNGLLKMVERGAFKPHIHDVCNFKDLIQAFDAIAAREVVGRIVIDALS